MSSRVVTRLNIIWCGWSCVVPRGRWIHRRDWPAVPVPAAVHRHSVNRSAAVPLAVAEPARRRLGIFTTADLAERGVSTAEIGTAVRRGTWVRLRTGVFVSADDLAEVERTDRRPGLDALAV